MSLLGHCPDYVHAHHALEHHRCHLQQLFYDVHTVFELHGLCLVSHLQLPLQDNAICKVVCGHFWVMCTLLKCYTEVEYGSGMLLC